MDASCFLSAWRIILKSSCTVPACCRRSVHMATTVWKGHLTFGLISIPMRMSAAARGERISFNQLHNVCHSRVKQPLFCPVCNRNVERSEIVKGHEYEKDQYVLFSEEELDKIEPSSAKVMEILEFVRLDDMDPLYFDSSYYVAPEDAGVKAYKLLMSAMKESGYGAIAKLTMHQREHIVILRPGSRGMTLHTMFYSNEIRAAESVPTDKVELKDQEKKLANQLIESLAAPFAPEKYRDEYQENVSAQKEPRGETGSACCGAGTGGGGKKASRSSRGSRCNGAEEGKEGRRLSFRPHHFDGPDGQIQPRRSPAHFGSHGKAAGLLGTVAPRFSPKRKRESLLRFWRPDRPAHGKAAGRKRRPGEPPAEIACCAARKTCARDGSALGVASAFRRRSGDRRTRRNAAGAAVRPVRAELRDSRIERIRARHDGTQRRRMACRGARVRSRRE